jgi:hypothetical protein
MNTFLSIPSHLAQSSTVPLYFFISLNYAASVEPSKQLLQKHESHIVDKPPQSFRG